MNRQRIAAQLVRLAKELADEPQRQAGDKDFLSWHGYRDFSDTVEELRTELAGVEGYLADIEGDVVRVSNMLYNAAQDGYDVGYLRKYVERAYRIVNASKARDEVKKIIKAIEII